MYGWGNMLTMSQFRMGPHRRNGLKNDRLRKDGLRRGGLRLERVWLSALLPALVVSLMLGAAGCAKNPVTGKSELSFLSESQEIEMGKQADPGIIATYGLYEHGDLEAYVDRVGQKLVRVSHRPDLEFTFRVLDSPIINAFALPGGYIYLTRGILEHMNDEAELAIVLGHEIGHVTAKHSVNQYSRAQLAGLGFGVASVFSETVAEYGEVAQAGLGLLFLKHGRDDERQADELGVEYALRAGYDAAEGVEFFEVLERVSERAGQSLPSWLSTHPNPGDRVSRTRSLAAELAPEFPDARRVGRDTHLEQIDGAVYGVDPRQGVTRDSRFMHPTLEFQLDFPKGWNVINSASTVTAVEPDQEAGLQLAISDRFGSDLRDHVTEVARRGNASILESRQVRLSGGALAYLSTLERSDPSGQATRVFFAAIDRGRSGEVFEVVGMAAPSMFGRHVRSFESAVTSFGRLTDPEVLALEPNRVSVREITSTMTLREAISRQGANAAEAEDLVLLNNVDLDEVLAVGTDLKLVMGTFRDS